MTDADNGNFSDNMPGLQSCSNSEDGSDTNTNFDMITNTDEVQVYFGLPHKNFDSCDPLQWWAGCLAQFPSLSQFAQDILLIPGES